MTVLAYGGGHFVAAVSLAAIIISVIYYHNLILVSGEVLHEYTLFLRNRFTNQYCRTIQQ